MDTYWADYDATLARVRTERPGTFAELQAILNTFQPPSSGAAFFPDGADDVLMAALQDAGWEVIWAAAYYHYIARHTTTGATLTYVEGDLYEGKQL